MIPFNEAQETLAKLLREPIDLDREPIGSDVLFLATSCCATMIVHIICTEARHDPEPAGAGLDALVEDMRKHIGQIIEARRRR